MRILLPLCFLLTACVGGTLTDKGAYEEYSLTPATPQEEARMRRCLLAIYRDQMDYYKTKRTFTRRTQDLNIDTECADILVGLRAIKGRFMAIARINRDESTVRWSIDEKKEIYEYTETEFEDELW